MDLLLCGPNIPRDFASVRFADYDRSRGDPEIAEALEGWSPRHDEPIVLLQGPPGLGKTMLSSAMLVAAQARVRCRGVKPACERVVRQMKYPVYFIQMAQLVELYIRSFRLFDLVTKAGRDPDGYYELERLIDDLANRVQLLVLDDIGKEHRTASGFAVDVFDLLMRSRLNNGLPTVLTSNWPLYRWSDEYSPSMKNLIERSGLICQFQF